MNVGRFRCDLEIKLAGAGAKPGTFEGYGSVFGNTDAGGDAVAKGAFKDSLATWKAKGKLPKMLLQHGGFFGPAEDGIPIGKYTHMEEDSKGLYLKGELFALDTPKGKYIYEGMSSGELDGLSIGYIPREVELNHAPKPGEPRRTLKRVDLLEVSVVTFPMNKEATVEAVKSIEQLMNFAEAEAYLRDVAGFSQRQAVAFVSRVKSLSPSDSEKALEAAAIGRQLLSRFKSLHS